MPFSIFDDVFLPANDPYGRNGPTLDEMILSKVNSKSNENRSTIKSSDTPKFEQTRANKSPVEQNIEKKEKDGESKTKKENNSQSQTFIMSVRIDLITALSRKVMSKIR